MENSNLTILFVNTYFILSTAGTVSPQRLLLDLSEIETTLTYISTSIPLLPEVLTLIISSFLIVKFLFNYISLAGHVIALYPILNYDLSDLLIPTIIIQTLQNIILNLGEFFLGYFTCRYYLTSTKVACRFFYIRMISKTILGAMLIDLYWGFYNHLRYPLIKSIPTRTFLKQITKSDRLLNFQRYATQIIFSEATNHSNTSFEIVPPIAD